MSVVDPWCYTDSMRELIRDHSYQSVTCSVVLVIMEGGMMYYYV